MPSSAAFHLPSSAALQQPGLGGDKHKVKFLADLIQGYGDHFDFTEYTMEFAARALAAGHPTHISNRWLFNSGKWGENRYLREDFEEAWAAAAVQLHDNCQFWEQMHQAGTAEWRIASQRPDLMCRAAAATGQLALLQLLHSNSVPWNNDVCTAAAEHGQLHILEWLHQHAPAEFWTADTAYIAAMKGRVAVLRWLQQHALLLDVPAEMLAACAKEEQMEAMQRLLRQGPRSASADSNAAAWLTWYPQTHDGDLNRRADSRASEAVAWLVDQFEEPASELAELVHVSCRAWLDPDAQVVAGSSHPICLDSCRETQFLVRKRLHTRSGTSTAFKRSSARLLGQRLSLLTYSSNSARMSSLASQKGSRTPSFVRGAW